MKDTRVYTSSPGSNDVRQQAGIGPDTPSPENEREIRQRKRIRDVNVMIYMTDWCGYCKKASEFIQSMGVNLIEYNVERDNNRRDEMLKKTGSQGVPAIDVDGIVIRGHNPGIFKPAIEKKADL